MMKLPDGESTLTSKFIHVIKPNSILVHKSAYIMPRGQTGTGWL